MSKKFVFFITLIALFQYGNTGNTIGPRLQFLVNADQAGLSSFYGLPELEKIPVTLTFDQMISAEALSALEKTGFQPHLYKNEALRSQRVMVGYLHNPSENLSNFSNLGNQV